MDHVPGDEDSKKDGHQHHGTYSNHGGSSDMVSSLTRTGFWKISRFSWRANSEHTLNIFK